MTADVHMFAPAHGTRDRKTKRLANARWQGPGGPIGHCRLQPVMSQAQPSSETRNACMHTVNALYC
eukprot:11164259-Lingulodinium_polyedra.AAC.1